MVIIVSYRQSKTYTHICVYIYTHTHIKSTEDLRPITLINLILYQINEINNNSVSFFHIRIKY